MKQLLVIAVFVFSVSLNAQITFQIIYGDTGVECGYGVIETFDRGYLIAGSSYTPDYSEGNALLIKTNKFGDTLWTRKYGGQYTNYSRCAQQLPDSGYVVASCGSDPYIGFGILRLDKFGDTLWTKSWSGAIASVTVLADGGFVLTGLQNLSMYVARLDANGDSLWMRCYGGTNTDWSMVTKATTDGGFVICGASKSWGAGNFDYYVVKTDSLGNVQWSNVYGGTADDRAEDIIEISTGGYLMIGTAYSYSFQQFSPDMLVMRLDSNGTLIGAATFGGAGYDFGSAVRELTSGEFLLSGHSQSFGNSNEMFLVKLGSGGNMMWSKTFGTTDSESAFAMALTSDGGCVMTGVTGLGSDPGNVFFVKVDSAGMSNCLETVAACTMNVVYPWTDTATTSTFDYALIGNQYYTESSGLVVIPICTVAQTEELKPISDCSVFPNPFAGTTTVQFSNPSNSIAILTVFDGQGRVVQIQENITGELVILDGELITSGIYFFRIEADSQCLGSGKLIRE